MKAGYQSKWYIATHLVCSIQLNLTNQKTQTKAVVSKLLQTSQLDLKEHHKNLSHIFSCGSKMFS